MNCARFCDTVLMLLLLLLLPLGRFVPISHEAFDEYLVVSRKSVRKRVNLHLADGVFYASKIIVTFLCRSKHKTRVSLWHLVVLLHRPL